MAEWGVRLEEPGCEPHEFKVPTGKDGAEAYVAFIDMSAVSRMRGDKATVITRATAADPWKMPGDG